LESKKDANAKKGELPYHLKKESLAWPLLKPRSDGGLSMEIKNQQNALKNQLESALPNGKDTEPIKAPKFEKEVKQSPI